MPYPESCPECGGPFRNTGTHFTARRNELGRHVLLELGCQNTTGRFWWDFTTGAATEEGRAIPARRVGLASLAPDGASSIASNGVHHARSNGHASLATLEPPLDQVGASEFPEPPAAATFATLDEPAPAAPAAEPQALAIDAGSAPAILKLEDAGPAATPEPVAALDGIPSGEVSGLMRDASTSLKEAFVRQLQLDRLTLRQMRSWLMSDESRRAIEVAAGATEATYERLALILFGVDLPELSGKPAAPPISNGLSAEQRLELQREKARIRARQRRAAAKAARPA